MEIPKQEYTDPKTQFLMKLVNRMDEIKWQEADGFPSRANILLAEILSEITIDDGKPFAEELTKLQNLAVFNYDNYYRTTPQEVRKRIYMVNQHLNMTYFKDFKSAQPRKGDAGY